MDLTEFIESLEQYKYIFSQDKTDNIIRIHLESFFYVNFCLLQLINLYISFSDSYDFKCLVNEAVGAIRAKGTWAPLLEVGF